MQSMQVHGKRGSWSETKQSFAVNLVYQSDEVIQRDQLLNLQYLDVSQQKEGLPKPQSNFL